MANDSDNSTGTLKMYVNDMLTLQKHILEAVERQINDEDLKGHSPAATLANTIHTTLHGQVNDLTAQVERLGSEVGASIKAAVGAALGVLAGLYDKVRKDPVSRMLRDDYTALCMSTISYNQLHTTGLAFGDHAVAELALRHLKAIAPIIMQINEVMPGIVAKELQDDGFVTPGAAQQAVANTQAAWKSQN